MPDWTIKGTWSARHPSAQDTFSAEDQQQFCSGLAMTLVHVGLFKQAAKTNAPRPANINSKVTFNSTVYHAGAANKHWMSTYRSAETEQRVRLIIWLIPRGGHIWIPKGMWGVDAFKTAAATDLLHKMMPDVESWMQHGHTITQAVPESRPEQPAAQ